MGRRWLGVFAAVLAVANAALVVVDLSAGDVVTAADRVLTVVRIVLVGTFTLQALYELRPRVLVDGIGVHHQELRRRTYRWQEISEIRSAAKWGESFVELVRHDGEAVRLPRSTERLDVLRRWHAAASGQPRP
ncbi:hypothetical protein [Georgenia sp. Marseille-Q6866]